MESIDWINLTAVGAAIFILVGGMLMMFTDLWTTKRK